MYTLYILSYWYETGIDFYYLETRYYDPEIGRFISPDNTKYLDPETLGGLNLYAYCNNNPVMYADPSGTTVFMSMLIAGIIIGAGIGGALNGIQAYDEGVRGIGLFGSIVGGALMGGAMGAVLVLGGASGLASGLAPLTITGFSLTKSQALGCSLAIGISAGIGSYALENGFRNDKEITREGLLLSGVSGLLKGLSTFAIGYAGGKSGFFDKMIIKTTLKEQAKDSMSYMLTKSILNGLRPSMFRTFSTYANWYLGESISKMLFVSSIAAGLRWLIDRVFEI